jgi:hypothetical protein
MPGQRRLDEVIEFPFRRKARDAVLSRILVARDTIVSLKTHSCCNIL